MTLFDAESRRLIHGPNSVSFGVTGGREFCDWALVDFALSRVKLSYPKAALLQGGAKGADFLCKAWAKYNDMDHEEEPADWNAHGRKAGPLRNQKMLDRGLDFLVAFPGDDGTKDMISICHRAGKYIWRPHLAQEFRYRRMPL